MPHRKGQGTTGDEHELYARIEADIMAAYLEYGCDVGVVEIKKVDAIDTSTR